MPLAMVLSLLLFLGLLPAAVLGNLFVRHSLTDIHIAQDEVHGLAYLRAIWPAYTMAVDGRTAASAQARAIQVRPRIEAAARELDQSFETSTLSGVVLRSLRDTEKTGYTGAPTGVGTLMTQVGDRSGLILDPQLDTYYLMDVVLLKMRAVSDAEARAENGRGTAESAIANAAFIDAVKQANASVLLGIRANASGSLQASRLPALMAELKSAAQAKVDQIALGENGDGTRFARIRDQVWTEAANDLDRLLHARMNDLQRDLRNNVILSGIIAVLAIAWGVILIRALSQGMGAISRRLNALADGDTESAVPGTDLRNDIGVIARALEDFIERDGEREALAAELARAREESQSALEVTVARVNSENEALRLREAEQLAASQDAERRTVEALARDLEARVSGLLAVTREAADAMDTSSNAMAGIASKSFESTGDATAAATRIRETVDYLAPRVVAISGTLKALRERSDAGRAVATSAIDRIDTAAQRMDAFAAATDRIDQMQATIVRVASQTNMLALNASIEAMRVGEAGEGFMVVANEVKALSGSTKQAANDIGVQIAGMRAANAAVIEGFEAILHAMRELAQSALTISDGIAEQTDGIAEVERAMVAANDTVTIMANGMGGANSAARAARDTSGEIATTCTRVIDQLASLDSTIADFTAGLKRAQAAG